MKVFITGGTGFVGSYLSRELARRGHDITILTRRTELCSTEVPGLCYIAGDPTQEGDWMEKVPGHDWLINLAGASIFTRWSKAHKQEIYDSRIQTTRNLVRALGNGGGTRLLCSTSAVGYYGPHGDEELTEDAPPGQDFLANLARDWEAEALKAQEAGARVVLTRFGIVLGKSGGALAQMLPAFKWFVGGPLGSGEQWFSWIHQMDQVRAYLFVLEHPDLSGPVNFTAPYPVRNRELARALGRALHRPAVLPAPPFMLRLVLGEMAEVLLAGQKVLPRRLLDAGFEFQFPGIDAALADLAGG